MSFISSFEIIIVLMPDPKTFFWIAPSVAKAATVNLNGIKTPLANGLGTFFIKGKPDFSNGLKILPKNPDYPIFWNWVFDSFMLADELLAKAVRILKTCVLVNNNLREKLYSSLELSITFD